MSYSCNAGSSCGVNCPHYLGGYSGGSGAGGGGGGGGYGWVRDCPITQALGSIDKSLSIICTLLEKMPKGEADKP